MRKIDTSKPKRSAPRRGDEALVVVRKGGRREVYPARVVVGTEPSFGSPEPESATSKDKAFGPDKRPIVWGVLKGKMVAPENMFEPLSEEELALWEGR